MATAISRAYDGGYVVSFGDDVFHATLTDSGDLVDSWLAEVYGFHRLVVGLDVEWRPAQSSYDAPPPVALLQVCVGRRCPVLQILHADYVPRSLRCFLADERFTFVCVGVHDDAAKLRAGYGLRVRSAVDLRALAASALGNPALRGACLQSLVREVMGVESS